MTPQELLSGHVVLLLPEMIEQDVTETGRAVASQETDVTDCLCTHCCVVRVVEEGPSC